MNMDTNLYVLKFIYKDCNFNRVHGYKIGRICKSYRMFINISRYKTDGIYELWNVYKIMYTLDKANIQLALIVLSSIY